METVRAFGYGRLQQSEDHAQISTLLFTKSRERQRAQQRSLSPLQATIPTSAEFFISRWWIAPYMPFSALVMSGTRQASGQAVSSILFACNT